MTRPPSSPRSWLVDAPVLAVAIAWGSSYLATKSVTSPSTVIATLLLRFLMAVAVLGLLRLRAIRRLTAAEVCGGIIIGLILTCVFLLETYGVVHTSATNAGLIISLTMVFTPLAEAALCRKRPTGSFLMAAAGSVLGVLLLTQGGGFTAPSVGDLLMLLAALARTANVLTTHRLASIKNADDGALTFVQLTTSVICFAAPVSEENTKAFPGELSTEGLATLLCAGPVGEQDRACDHVDGLPTPLMGLGALDAPAVVGVLHEQFEAIEVDARPAQGAHLAST